MNDIPAAAPDPQERPWTPTAENINNLPDPLRSYIHDLETRCDPASDVRTLAVLREQIQQITVRCLDAEAALQDCEADTAALRAQLDLQKHEAETRWAENAALQIMQQRALNAEASLTELRGQLEQLIRQYDVTDRATSGNHRLVALLNGLEVVLRARLAVPPPEK